MMSNTLQRRWEPFYDWEEIRFNMWGEATDPKFMLEQAIAFTSDHVLYGSYMQRVIKEWPVSCRNALTDKNINQKAWIGHAAAALALNCPEDITRKAWGFLTDEQQFLANEQARQAIEQWVNDYTKTNI